MPYAFRTRFDVGVVRQIWGLVALPLHLDQPFQRDGGIARDEEHRVEIEDATVRPVYHDCQRLNTGSPLQMVQYVP